MQRSDLWLIMATFIFGFAAGVYVYFTMYEPNFRFAVTSGGAPETTFQVTGEAYGECEQSVNGCGSFRLLSNRDYRLVFTDTTGTVQQSREGMISNSLLEDFLRQLNLVYQNHTLNLYPTTPPTCQSEPSGILYTVDIPDEDRYYLDECSRVISGDDALWHSLEQISHSFQLRGQ